MSRPLCVLLLICSAALVCLSGCRLLGVDKRSQIYYERAGKEEKHREYKEPMYTRRLMGTDFIKLWPKRLGPTYGYAPWERRQAIADGVLAADEPAEKNIQAAPARTARAKGRPKKKSTKKKPSSAKGELPTLGDDAGETPATTAARVAKP